MLLLRMLIPTRWTSHDQFRVASVWLRGGSMTASLAVCCNMTHIDAPGQGEYEHWQCSVYATACKIKYAAQYVRQSRTSAPDNWHPLEPVHKLVKRSHNIHRSHLNGEGGLKCPLVYALRLNLHREVGWYRMLLAVRWSLPGKTQASTMARDRRPSGPRRILEVHVDARVASGPDSAEAVRRLPNTPRTTEQATLLKQDSVSSVMVGSASVDSHTRGGCVLFAGRLLLLAFTMSLLHLHW